MLRRAELSLRWSFVLVLLGGALLPMGVLGYWLARSAARSGEDLLRARLEESLLQATRDVGARWIEIRSLLLDVSEHPSVLGVMTGSDPPRSSELPDGLAIPVAAASPLLERLSLHAPDGSELWRLHPRPSGEGYPEPWVGVSVPVFRGVTGDPIASVRARVRWSALTRGQNPEAAANALLAVRSTDSGRVVVAGSLDPELMAQPRFSVGAETWVGARRTVGDPPLELLMAAPLDPFQRPFLAAARNGTIALALVGTGSLLLVVLLTGRLTASLRRLTEASDAVAGGDLERRVPEDGGREISHLAASFNAMTDRLRTTLSRLASRESLAAVGEFAAALSHEVRNPLSSVRLDLQMAREEIGEAEGGVFVDRALRSVERLDRTVTGALRIARSGRVERRDIDLVPVLEGALHGAEGALEARGIRVVRDPTVPESLLLRGDAAALEQVFLNLLLNSAQAAGGVVRLSMETVGDDVVVTVRDDGPGIPGEIGNRVFEPFFTTREDGTGLGLAMARTIVEAHGGRIEVVDVPAGAAFRLRLPRNGA